MSEERGPMGKLILLRRVREQAESAALGRASEKQAQAKAAEAEAAARHRAVRERLAGLRGEVPDGRPPAQVLQFQGRLARRLQVLAERLELEFAAMRGEHISAAEATARVQASLAAARRAREQIQERLAAAREERRRRREAAEERERDDGARSPPRGRDPR